jgi:hypothetical protein
VTGLTGLAAERMGEWVMPRRGEIRLPVSDAWSCLWPSDRAHRALPRHHRQSRARAAVHTLSTVAYTAAPSDDLDPKSHVVFCAEMIPLEPYTTVLCDLAFPPVWGHGILLAVLFARLPGMLTGTVAPPSGLPAMFLGCSSSLEFPDIASVCSKVTRRHRRRLCLT